MKFELERPVILSQHVDSLTATFKAVNEADYKRYILKIFNPLEVLKDDAQNVEGFDNKSRYINCEPFTGYGTFRMHAQGSGQYRYILSNDDCMIFMSGAKFDSDAPLLKIEFRAHYLFAVGQNKAYEYALKLVAYMLGTQFESSVQRIDVATDIMGVGLEYLDSVRFQNRYKSSVYRKGKRLTGLSFGGGDFMFRIYDKLEEIRSNYSKHYVKKKWAYHGFDEKDGHSVTRFEAQFRRGILKKFFPKDTAHEVEFVFNNLGGLWKSALDRIKYAPLTNEECIKIIDGQGDGDRMIYKRARDDEGRYQFQNFLRFWDNSISDRMIDYKEIKEPVIQTAKKMLKGFISAAYKSGETNPQQLSEILQEVQRDFIKYDGITIHDYGLAKTVDSFIYQMKQKEKHGCIVEFDHSQKAGQAYSELYNKFNKIDDVLSFMPNVSKCDDIASYFKDGECVEAV
jgi:hypothetical protein